MLQPVNRPQSLILKLREQQPVTDNEELAEPAIFVELDLGLRVLILVVQLLEIEFLGVEPVGEEPENVAADIFEAVCLRLAFEEGA